MRVVQVELASDQIRQQRSAASQQERAALHDPPRVLRPLAFHGVSRGEQAAMLMNVISGVLRVYHVGLLSVIYMQY